MLSVSASVLTKHCFQCPEDGSTQSKQRNRGTGSAQVRKAMGQLRKNTDGPWGSSNRYNNAREGVRRRTEHNSLHNFLEFLHRVR